MKTRRIITLVLSALLGLAFAGAGFAKISGQVPMIENFTRWGIPLSLMYALGVVELLMAVALQIPRFRRYGLAAVGVVMVGALFTHIRFGEYGALTGPLVLSSLALIVFFLSRPAVNSQILR